MNLTVSSSPHVRGNDSTRRIMRDVNIALLPALIFGIVHFGVSAAIVTVVCILTAVVTELAANRFLIRDHRELDAPLWLPVCCWP